MAKKITTDKQEEEIASKYLAGKTTSELSAEYGFSKDVIRRVLKQHNIPFRKNISYDGKSRIPLAENLAERIIHDYVVNQYSIYSLQKKYNLSQRKIETCLKRYGVNKRTYVEAKQLSRVYELNDDFFKDQTPNMAYVLGLIAADGNVAKNENCISIELEKTDVKLLEEINQITGNTRPLKFYTHDHHNGAYTEAVKFQAWSAEWKQDLATYGIVPAKTYVIVPPVRLKKELYIYYLKGYFDGDGSFYVRKDCDTSGVISFIGASKPLVKWVQNVLVNQYGIITGEISTRVLNSGHYFYKFCVYNHNGIKQLYHLWYDDPTILSLDRKKAKLTSFINNIE